MLRAEELNIPPELLIERISKDHRQDFTTFNISVDNYLHTHATENRELTELIYNRLLSGGYISRQTIKQAYDETRKIFLPDRYVRGQCPVGEAWWHIRRRLRWGACGRVACNPIGRSRHG